MNEKDIERLKELEEAYNNCNDKKEKKKIYGKISYIKHKEYHKEYNKEYRKNHKEYHKEYIKEYYKNNQDKIKEYKKELYENNKDEINLNRKLENDESRNQANNHRQRWTNEETDLLYHYYIEENKMSKEISLLMGRTISSIVSRLSKMGILKYKEEIK